MRIKTRAELPWLYYPRGDRVLISAHRFAPAWTPANIATALWLDAADAATVTLATGVAAWVDKSGNGRTASQGTAANQPSYAATLNGNSVLTFDGSNDALSLAAGLTLGVNFGLFVLFRPATTIVAATAGTYLFSSSALGSASAPLFLFGLGKGFKIVFRWHSQSVRAGLHRLL